MSRTIVYTHTARQDLRDIYEYISQVLLVPRTARALTERIMSEINTLTEFPERNPLYKEEPWYSKGVRFLPVKNYLVFYTVNTGTITVVRIMYGGRDISRQLEDTSEW